MLDMHSHILYGVDDGPKSLEQSLEMLVQATKEGITEILSTSHVNHPQYEVSTQQVLAQVPQLQRELEARNIELKLHTGHEIRISADLVERLDNGVVLPLANSQYVLVELPSSTVPTYTKQVIIMLKAHGYTPIIAHPERNKSIAEKPAKLEALIREGALSQVTAGSITGHFGKSVQKTAIDLVKANLVHTYGSDAHNLNTRPFLFDAGLTYLEKHKLAESVDLFLENNARIVENREMILLEPQEIKKKWFSFLGK